MATDQNTSPGTTGPPPPPAPTHPPGAGGPTLGPLSPSQVAPAGTPARRRRQAPGWVRSTARYLRIALRAFGEMLDVGLLVAGTGFVAIGITVLLGGFGIVEVGLAESAGAMLGSGIVLGVVGAFALGVAAEGPVGHPSRLGAVDALESAAARAFSLILVGLGFLAAGSLAEPLVADLPAPFVAAVDFLGAVGLAGCTVAVLVGLPALFLLERARRLPAWVRDWQGGVLYIAWAVGAALLS